MLDALLGLCRFFQYAGATILFGSSLLLIYGSPLPSTTTGETLKWVKSLLCGAALAVLAATVFGFIVQTSHLAGSLVLAFEPGTLKSALWDMSFGKSSLVRAGLALLCFITVMLLPAGNRLWWICTVLGAFICASFVWMGHGAATEGSMGIVHLIGDIAHILAAAGWIGALAIFCLVLARLSPEPTAQKAICASLASFSGAGSVLVAIIIVSGLVNSAFLVGWDIKQIVSTPYGQVLIAKLLLFAAMLALAVRNRFRHAPALATALQGLAPPQLAMANLRRSIVVETCAAIAILVLVSWLGMQEPLIG